MKKVLLTLLVATLAGAGALTVTAFKKADGGNAQTLPSVKVKTLDGKFFNTADIKNDGKPVVISFWATWCAPCKKELNAINEVYADWQTETGVKVIAVSIDDARNSGKVKPYVDAKSWEYDVYLDENQDLKRAMNVNNVPHTFLLNGKGEIVWQHTNYVDGDEKILFENIKKAAKGEKIDH